jgi:hypothetical protein
MALYLVVDRDHSPESESDEFVIVRADNARAAVVESKIAHAEIWTLRGDKPRVFKTTTRTETVIEEIGKEISNGKAK